MSETTGKWVGVSLVLWTLTAVGLLWYALFRPQSPPLTDGGAEPIYIDLKTCKAFPPWAIIDTKERAKSDRPNHYEVEWRAVGDLQEGSRVLLERDDRPDPDIKPPHAVPGAFPPRHELKAAMPRPHSGRPLKMQEEWSYWAYTVRVLDAHDKDLCPPIDPGICFPGTGSECPPRRP